MRVFLLPLLLATTLACSTIYRGGSGCDDDATCKLIATEMGGTHVRVYLHWKYIQRNLKVDSTMSVQKVEADPSLIDTWAKSADVNWHDHDRRVGNAMQAGLTMIGEVGEGTLQGLPLIDGSTTPADPKNIGKDIYLGYLYLTTRAIVRRFKDRISMWQIENELNGARGGGE
jgi:hypothetical protein